MKIPETVSVSADGKEYKIDKDVWDKYAQMHPIRTMDSLNHDISKFIVYDGKTVSAVTVEKMIMEEYNHISKMNFPNMINTARQIYDNKNINN